MTDHELEQRIRKAVEHTTPDLLDEILSSCDQQNTMTGPSVCQAHTDERSEGAIIEMSENKNPNSRSGRIKKSLAAVAAVAAMLVVCIGGFQLFQGSTAPAVDSVILLDVNPSLSLTVDAEETVLAVEALNSDAEEVLGTMELEDTSLEVAVNAIIGSMLQKGYLGDLQNAILVSVENEDAARGEALQQKVSDAITSAARNGSLDAAVLSQLLTGDNAALAELAEQYQISLGKAALIQEVIAQAPTLTFEDLAPMTINEIALIAASKNVSSASVTQSGDASDKAYLTRTEALDVVYGHAGVTAEEVVMAKVEFDSEHGVMIYEVEFETAAKEGEYEINAATGEILKSELKDRSNAAQDSSYLGEAAARDAALAHAGVAETDVLEIEVELDSDDHRMIYEVQFRTASREYEYEIDAVTGAVVAYETEGQKKTSVESSQPSTSAGGSYIGESAAKEAALTHAGVTEGSTTYVNCYLEYEGGKPACYCVEFKVNKTEYEYEIDLYSGAVLSHDTEHHDNSGSNESAASDSSESASYIGESAALTAALQHAGVAESSLREQHVELDRDGSTMVYQVEFKTADAEYEYKVDAVSGAILKSEHHGH